MLCQAVPEPQPGAAACQWECPAELFGEDQEEEKHCTERN